VSAVKRGTTSRKKTKDRLRGGGSIGGTHVFAYRDNLPLNSTYTGTGWEERGESKVLTPLPEF